MTALADAPAARLTDDAPLLARTGAVLLLACLPLAIGTVLDPRMVDFEPVWLKPLKFALSLAAFALTLAWAARFLPPRIRHHPWLRRWDAVVVACIAAEMVWITGAAALATRSHYNEETALMAAIYPFMGLVAITLTSGALVRGILTLRHGWGEVERAAGWSFIATFALTVPIASTLTVAPVAGAGLPPFGWTLAPGDIRPAHFLATHAMQAVPLAALALAALRPPPWGTGAVLTAAWSALTFLAFAYGMGWTGLPPLL